MASVLAALGPMHLEAEHSSGCIAHAGYLARHLDHDPEAYASMIQRILLTTAALGPARF